MRDLQFVETAPFDLNESQASEMARIFKGLAKRPDPTRAIESVSGKPEEIKPFESVPGLWIYKPPQNSRVENGNEWRVIFEVKSNALIIHAATQRRTAYGAEWRNYKFK